MAATKLPGLSDQSLTKSFRGVEAILREDEVLKQVIRTWRTWTGSPEDSTPPQDAEMPWVRLTPAPSGSASNYIDLDNIKFAILVEFAIEGTNYDNALNLWQAFHDAMRHQKPFRDSNVAMYLRSQGSRYNKITEPNFRKFRLPLPDPSAQTGPYNLYTSASIILYQLIPS